jgi:hypothetical protein
MDKELKGIISIKGTLDKATKLLEILKKIEGLL